LETAQICFVTLSSYFVGRNETSGYSMPTGNNLIYWLSVCLSRSEYYDNFFSYHLPFLYTEASDCGSSRYSPHLGAFLKGEV
jgi:hypothetical protein